VPLMYIEIPEVEAPAEEWEKFMQAMETALAHGNPDAEFWLKVARERLNEINNPRNEEKT